MYRGVKGCILSFCLIFAVFFCLSLFTPILSAQTLEKGNLIGYVLDRDGKTPVPGAVIKVRNVTTGAVYESTTSDSQGVFKIEGLSKGIYSFGITTALGDFNSNELIGILPNETTKISLSLNPYESGIQSAVQEVLRDQAENAGESRIGRVVGYNPETQEAEIFVEKGLIQVDDRIRIRGAATNFYQDVGSLRISQNQVRMALAGETPGMKVKSFVQAGDIVYIVCKKGVTPFFLTPCGIVGILAGTGAIMAGIITITEKTPVSAIK